MFCFADKVHLSKCFPIQQISLSTALIHSIAEVRHACNFLKFNLPVISKTFIKNFRKLSKQKFYISF